MSAKAQPSAVSLGHAVRRAMKLSATPTQIPFADALGVDQTTVSKWMLGKTALTVEQVRQIEDICGLPRGQILIWGGYVDVDADIGVDVDDFGLAAAAGANRRRAREVAPAIASVRRRQKR